MKKGNQRHQPGALAAAAGPQQSQQQNLHQQPVPQTPTSPTTKGTSKYTNKDGSKFITVPKIMATDSPQPSPTASSVQLARPPAESNQVPPPAPPVNRKKQKRRAKAAAKLAAAETTGGRMNGAASPIGAGSQDSIAFEAEAEDSDNEPDQLSDQALAPQENGNTAPGDLPKSKKSKKKKKRKNELPSDSLDPLDTTQSGQSADTNRPSGISKEKIWNTSSQEERERIKEFWLGLGEDERKSLVKVEKDAVLKKMKEQQKHTCSCTVCGRKRTAIEEELEGLYDAYYEELEQFANHPNRSGDGPPLMGPPRDIGHMGAFNQHRLPSTYAGQPPSRGRIVEHVGDEISDDAYQDPEGEYDEEYSDEELDPDDEEYSDEEDIPPEEIHRDYATDFFNFGNSLTVQGGILTVADDLLKNDGKKFIEMMEQLAERRMARDEDAKDPYRGAYGHVNGIHAPHTHSHSHNHPPPVEEDEYDEEEDEEEDYESQEEEYDEEEDTMTEEQRMEEGRRMFQIFAARMFEQRVLTAYREKVAKERQQKLLEELEEEDLAATQKKAKKAKDAQRRKDKAALKKQLAAEEKAKKEAEKAAEEAARQAEEAQKLEDARQKAEEKRRKKEALRKAEEEERLRKEAERLRKIHEQKERQAEQERKAREAKEREKKTREEARIKEKEVRERKEREARERREKQDRDKREKLERAEARLKAEKEAREAKDKQRQEDREMQKVSVTATPVAAIPAAITLPKRPAQHPSAVPVLPQQPPTGFSSPQISVATPALPKAPTPMKPRQPSQQDASQSGSATSLNQSPHSSTPAQASPGPIGPPSKGSITQNSSRQSQTTSPLYAALNAIKAPTGPANTATSQPGPFGMNIPPMGTMPFSPPPGLTHPGPPGPPGFASRMYDPQLAALGVGGGGYRAPGPPIGGVGMPIPPGLGPAGNRGFSPMSHPLPGFPQTLGDQLSAAMGQTPFGSLPKDIPPPTHSRHPSASFDSVPGAPSSQPIARPAPIGRPSSVVHGQRPMSESPITASTQEKVDFEGLDNAPHHLGSSALLDDSDEALHEFSGRRVSAAPSFVPGQRSSFPTGPFGGMPGSLESGGVFGSPSFSMSPWLQHAPQHNPFGHSPHPPPGFGNGGSLGPIPWGSPGNGPISSAFGGQGAISRPVYPRSVLLRQILCRVCRDLRDHLTEGNAHSPDSSHPDAQDGYIPLDAIKSHVELLNPGEPLDEAEVLLLFETEGNDTNGGGSFDVRKDPSSGNTTARWVPSSGAADLEQMIRRAGAVGAPGGR